MSDQEIEVLGFGSEPVGQAKPAEPVEAEPVEAEPAEPAEPVEPVKTDRPKLTAQDRIREINSKFRDEQRRADQLQNRIDRLEQGLTQAVNPVNPVKQSGGKPQASSYEYGSLDDQYIEDMIDWKAEQKTTEKFGEVSRRQEEQAAQAASDARIREVQTRADTVIAQGNKLYEDFDDIVVEAAYRGDWPLERATFEAMAESENGAAIAYELANNIPEAIKLASMTEIQQARYVFRRDAELSKAPPRVTKASAPPGTISKGSSGKFATAGDTDDLNAFEKMYFAKR